MQRSLPVFFCRLQLANPGELAGANGEFLQLRRMRETAAIRTGKRIRRQRGFTVVAVGISGWGVRSCQTTILEAIRRAVASSPGPAWHSSSARAGLRCLCKSRCSSGTPCLRTPASSGRWNRTSAISPFSLTCWWRSPSQLRCSRETSGYDPGLRLPKLRRRLRFISRSSAWFTRSCCGLPGIRKDGRNLPISCCMTLCQPRTFSSG